MNNQVVFEETTLTCCKADTCPTSNDSLGQGQLVGYKQRAWRLGPRKKTR